MRIIEKGDETMAALGIEEEEDDGILFEEKMENLTSELSEQFLKSRELEERIRVNLKSIGFEV